MDEPRTDEWADDALNGCAGTADCAGLAVIAPEPVAEQLPAAGCTVIWAPSPGARRASGAPSAGG